MYRCLFLINQFHNQCYVFTMIPSRIGFFGSFSVGLAVILIRLDHAITGAEYFICLYAFLIFMITSFLFLHISGKVFKDSCDLGDALLAEGWKSRSKLIRKMAKSLRPFGVRLGTIRTLSYAALSAFYITLVSILTTVLNAFPPHEM